jgi:ATP-dependent exoDNAse (exonuclease V) alpha subunit
VYWTGDREGEEERVYRGFTGVIRNGYVQMEAITKDGNMTTTQFLLEAIESKIMPWMVKTVHKSQGQSIENVVYLIKAGMGGKHSLELAYTAHSRAKSDCIVVTLCAEKRNPKLTADSKRRTSLGLLK